MSHEVSSISLLFKWINMGLGGDKHQTVVVRGVISATGNGEADDAEEQDVPGLNFLGTCAIRLR